MADLFDLVRDDPRVLTLIEALLSDKDSTAGSGPLAVLRIQQKKTRAAIKQKADSFSELYEQAVPGNANFIDWAQIAEVSLQNERAAAERLRPGIEALQEKLESGLELDHEIRKYFQENLEIAIGWLELHKNLRKKLLALSSSRTPGSAAVLRARLVDGDIDHEALSREFMARFPKIRAALAK